MHAKSFVWAALVVVIAGVASESRAQYGPMGPMSPYGGHPGMLPPGAMMGGPQMGGPAYGGPMMQGMPSIAPASYAAAMGAGGPSCTDPSCGPAGCDTCCDAGWCHHWNVFGEFLYMRARDAEVAYAVPIDGNITDDPNLAFQQGEVQVVDPDYQPGFRVGFGFTMSPCSAIQVTYTQLDADTSDDLVIPGGVGPVARSLVSPVIDAAVDTLDAQADLAIQFKLIDADYRGLLAYCDNYEVAYSVGARYAKLSQEFNALFEVNGFETVATDVDFEGGGLKLGLDGMWFGRNRQWFAYGKGAGSFIGGEFRASYFGTNDADDALVDTSWKAGRLVTITDIEAGLGWQNCCGNLRLSAGYMYSMWFNVVRTNEWIDAVQANNFTDRSDNFKGMMTFDGFTARVELLW
jgi:hypothetical protein